jgi:hypothetical protein
MLRNLYRSLRRISAAFVITIVAFLIIWAAIDMDDLMQLSTSLLGIAGAVGGLAALAYTHAGTLELPARKWLSREASILFQSTIFWVFTSGLAYVGGMQARQDQSVIRDFLVGVLIVMMCMFMLVAIIQAAFAINYVLDALIDPDEVAILESKQRGRVARLLNRNTPTANMPKLD